MVERALQDYLGIRKFGKEQVNEVSSFFSSFECVYCGKGEVRRWDHLVPVASGGETVLGNMVPACARCDDSKRALPYDEWMTGDSPGSPKSREVPDIEARTDTIKAYVTHFQYVPRTLEQRLTEDESKCLADIRTKLRQTRQEVETFIAEVRRRMEGAG